MKILLALLLVASTAHAETIGLYAPSAPFAGPVERLEYVTALAAHLGPGFRGKAYARAADFAAAVKRGELDYAVVDAAYLAASGAEHPVLAVAERDGGGAAAWELVTALPGGVATLRGKTVAVPDVGARAEAFVREVLLEGELDAGHLRVLLAPDALSALAAVERGRADAALVPAGLPHRGGMRALVTTRPVAWPLLVALRGPGDPAVAARAIGFSTPVFTGYATATADVVRALAGRFAPRRRRAPLLAPELRLGAAALFDTAPLVVPRGDPRALLVPAAKTAR